MPDLEIILSASEVEDYMSEIFPQMTGRASSFRVLDVSPGMCEVSLLTTERHLRPGGTVSGPALFGLADLAGYTCCLSHLGRKALAVTTNLNINFMRKSGPGEIRATGRVLKLGKSLLVFDCAIFGADDVGMIAHATGTYAIPPERK